MQIKVGSHGLSSGIACPWDCCSETRPNWAGCREKEKTQAQPYFVVTVIPLSHIALYACNQPPVLCGNK